MPNPHSRHQRLRKPLRSPYRSGRSRNRTPAEMALSVERRAIEHRFSVADLRYFFLRQFRPPTLKSKGNYGKSKWRA